MPPSRAWPLVAVSTLQPDLPEAVIRHQLRDWFGGQVDGWEHLRTYDIPYALPAAEPPDPTVIERRVAQIATPIAGG